MADPNPYRKIEIPEWIMRAIDHLSDDYKKRIIDRIQYLTHTRNKFERAHQREQSRVIKLKKILDEHGIAYQLKSYKDMDPHGDPIVRAFKERDDQTVANKNKRVVEAYDRLRQTDLTRDQIVAAVAMTLVEGGLSDVQISEIFGDWDDLSRRGIFDIKTERDERG